MLGRQRRGPGHSPRRNVEGSVHDHNHLNVQSVPLCGIPCWLVAHKHRILFCICEKKMGQEREEEMKPRMDRARGGGGGHKTKPYLSQTTPPFPVSDASAILGKTVTEAHSLRMIKLPFHFQVVISLNLCF